MRIAKRNDAEHFRVDHSGQSLAIARRNRYWNYKHGIDTRLELLAQQYELQHVLLSPGDRVIDCGANIGEIGAWAKQVGIEYTAFEPEPLEADCCDINAFDGVAKTNRLGLWHENTTLKFYSKPDTADGSLIEIDDYTDVHELEVITLASFLGEDAKKGIRLFKVEAEGAEPEVLQGAEPVLQYIDYISVDCGYERGKEKQATFKEVGEILAKHNFELISENKKRMVRLYKRRDCAT
ncbi:MAG: FkbM family methyltransferase [Rhizobiaceae bacterium]|nr:FkbM family methyltransferase [Rhizobiaceae bacterium]